MIKRGANSKGQVTIWIILAIVIVALVILLFALKVPQNLFSSSNPNVQLSDCLQPEIEASLARISLQGGSNSPVNFITYQDTQIEYLCYTNEYYKTCVMQQPLLKQHVERELIVNITPKINECLTSLKDNLENKGYTVQTNKEEVSLSLEPNTLKLVVSGITAEKENAVSYSKFVVEEKTRIYDLIMLATSILNWEARYGDSDITTYMAYYPNIKVEKYKQSDGSKIYILSSEGEKFMFATRSLSWPAGYGIGQTYKPTA
ncbi:MAG: hypothetical protein NT076_01140 [Candidatus Pacearchaeota archaeon]|nr:hypothetical protein [Candidatus Pacearchaeota archaeon]